MRKISFFIISCLLLSSGINAQVTIGSGDKPLSGALLDLKEAGTTKKGLGLPRVKLESLAKLKMGDNEILDTDNGGNQYKNHIGLVVYNTHKQETIDRVCPGLHVWDGSQWQSIVPYPAKKEDTRTIIEKVVAAEVSRTPINDPIKYPLGDLGTFNDVRGSGATEETCEYGYARFYTDRVVADGSYIVFEGVRYPYACDDSPAVIEQWREPDAGTGQITYIEDGVWMTSSLYTTKRSDGAPMLAFLNNGTTMAIPSVSDLSSLPAITFNENGPITLSALDFAKKFGLLYNVADNARVCPAGWHLPDQREWEVLIAVHGGPTIAGAKMRANNYDYGAVWGMNDPVGTTLSGFNAYPAGVASTDHYQAKAFGAHVYFRVKDLNGKYFRIRYDYASAGYSNSIIAGPVASMGMVSVRCIKD